MPDARSVAPRFRLDKVAIPFRADAPLLAGLAYRPTRSVRAAGLVLAHGFTASKAGLDLLAAYLAEKGYPVLTFDLPGHKLGASGGQIRSAADAVAAIEAAFAFARETRLARRLLVGGHSLGAAAAIAATAGGLPAHGVVALSIGREPDRGFAGLAGRTMLGQRADYVVGAPVTELIAGMGPLLGEIDRLQVPFLLAVGRNDVLLSADQVEALFADAPAPKRLAWLSANHQDAPEAARALLAGWLADQGF